MPSMTAPEATIPTVSGLDTVEPTRLERRGRAWLLWSFLLCPCHLPLTLGVLTSVLASTSLGVVLHDHVWVAGALISAAWLLGTGYGLRLVRQAERAGGACSLRGTRRGRRIADS